ncbi:MAG: ABC transporter permease [Muribaculaceae bacterium]
MKRTLSFIKKEFYHIFRDKRTMLIVIAMPIVQIILFGFAISTEVNNINFAVITPIHNESTRQLIEKIKANEYFTFSGYINDQQEIDDAFRKGKTDIILQFQEKFETQGKTPKVQIIVDASDPNTATIETMYLSNIINDFISKGNSGNIKSTTQLLYNPQMKSAYNFVPGIMGLILMLVCAMMTSISIVREKEVGTMEVLLVSPTKPLAIILTKMIPYFILSCANLLTILLLSVYVLHLPITGSIFWLIALSLIYITLALSFGLFISTVMETQVAAMLCAIMMLLFPTILLSGMMYPIENLPLPLQWLSTIIPARWYISGVKKLMIMGLPVEYIFKELVILISMTVIMITISVRKFKNRLE